MTEKQHYDVVRAYPGFELRRYAPHVVAEVEMHGSFERAGNAGFRPLVSYISGRNLQGTKVAMTAPVIQEPMDQEVHLVAFVMPAGAVTDDLPVPADAKVRIRSVDEELAAVLRFSGRWSLRSYDRHVEALRTDVQRAGLSVTGPPRFARFDPPWKPGFARRNEVVLPVASD